MLEEGTKEKAAAEIAPERKEVGKKKVSLQANKVMIAPATPDAAEFLLRLLEEEWAQARQSEDQRAIMTNLLIIIASATIGFLTQKGFILSSLPLALLLIIIGLFGMLASAKLYERHQFHIARVQTWRGQLEASYPNIQFIELRKAAKEKHDVKFWFSSKVHLHHLWLGLHLLISGAGVTTCTIILLQSQH